MSLENYYPKENTLKSKNSLVFNSKSSLSANIFYLDVNHIFKLDENMTQNPYRLIPFIFIMKSGG